MERKQLLDINGDKVTLTNILNLEPLYKENYEERKDIDKGWTKEKTMQKVASIPVEVLLRDYDGTIFYNALPGSPEATIALRRFLEKNPRYKCSNAKI